MIIALTFLLLSLAIVTESATCGCSFPSPASYGGSCSSQPSHGCSCSSPTPHSGSCCSQGLSNFRWGISDALKLLPAVTPCPCNGGGCQCPIHPACVGPPPTCKQQFGSLHLSRKNPITYDCLRNMQVDASNLATFVHQICSRCSNYPNAHSAIENLSNMARVYSMSIGNVANELAQKSGCARPILRLHDAIIATISNLATSAEHVDYNMRLSRGQSDCHTVSNTLTQTAQTYIGLLTAVMERVKSYMCTSETFLQPDSILHTADNIGLLAEQLAMATGKLFVTSGKCHHGNYLLSLDELTRQFPAITKHTDGLKTSPDSPLHPELAVIAHNLFVLTYSVMLQASDQHTGHIKQRTLQSDYAHEIKTVLQKKNQHLNWIHDQIATAGPSSNEMTDKLLATLIEMDVSLMGKTSDLIQKNKAAQKLALDLQITFEAAMAIVKAKILPGVETEPLQQVLQMAISTEEYAMKVLDIAQCHYSEEIDTVTGLRYLKELAIKLKGENVPDNNKIDAVLQLATTLKYVVDIPAKCPRKVSANHMCLMRDMSDTAKKYHESVSSILRVEADKAADKGLMNALRSVISHTWKMILQNTCIPYASKSSFALEYAKDVFKDLAVLFPKLLETTSQAKPVKLEKARQLVEAESAMLATYEDSMQCVTTQSQGLFQALHQNFLWSLTNAADYKQQAKDKINQLVTQVSPSMNENDRALHTLLQAMVEVIDAI